MRETFDIYTFETGMGPAPSTPACWRIPAADAVALGFSTALSWRRSG
jgi:hypothetical protein